MKKQVIRILVLQFFVFVIGCQLCIANGDAPIVRLFANDTIVKQNEEFCIDLRVENFVDVNSFQFVLSIDPSILQISGTVTDLAELTQPIAINTSDFNEGIITVVWLQFDEPDSVPDETSIMQICFNPIGEPGQSTDIEIISFRTITEPLVEVQDTCVQNFPDRVVSNVRIDCTDLYVQEKICHNGEDGGLVTLDICGGVPPYQYQISQNGDIIFQGQIDDEDAMFDPIGLPLGTYTIDVSDSESAENTMDVIIENLPPLSIELLSINPPICSDFFNGSIEVQGVGGSSLAIFGYDFAWSNGTYSSDLTGLPSNEYVVTVTDLAGCTETESYDLNVLPIQITNLELTPASTCNSNNGMLSFDLIGGTNGVTYDVVIFDIPFIGSGSSFVFDTLKPGDYQIDIEDLVGCWIDTIVTIEVVELMGPCDDNDECTVDDTFDENCDCYGFPLDDTDYDGFCDLVDCAPNDPMINPGADEIPNDGIDQNCDGEDLLSSISSIDSDHMSIYPNPFMDYLIIESELLGQKVELQSLDGRIVFQSTINEKVYRINLSDLKSGTYLLIIEDVVDKVIKL